MERLDKFLSQAHRTSRRESKTLIRAGSVTVNGSICTDPEQKLTEQDIVCLGGQPLTGLRQVVLLLHKPAGYVTSTSDPGGKTVMEVLAPVYRTLKPVGRLDKDTEGLLLFTNDGELAHKLISPKYEVEKEYYAEHEGTATEQDVQAFAEGLTLRDGTVCKKAVLTILSEGKCRVTVTEGRYHQVRRMLASRSLPVTYLRREREGEIRLGDLPCGSARELTPTEQQTLGNIHKKFFR